MESGGLLGGLNAYLLRMLCENPWEGGGGYLPCDVSRLTLDQCWFRLCSIGVLGSSAGRTQSVSVGEVKRAEDGTIKGRAADGSPIRGRVTGKSLARRLMEEEAEKKRVEEQKRERRERRRRKRR